MKKVTRFLFLSFAFGWGGYSLTMGQAYFSGYDFNQMPLTIATFGPNATSADPNAVCDGMAAYVNANCGTLKGIDLTIPVASGIFNQASLGMTFRFRKYESRSDFFVRGGTSFYQTGGLLYVNFRTSNGAGGFIDYGPYNTGYTLLADASYHEYGFIYKQALGYAEVKVDGATVWSIDGPDNRPLYWTGAPDVKVGTVMDGNCPGVGILDYVYFYNPDGPLNVEYVAFEAMESSGNVELAWETTTQLDGFNFTIERSQDGQNFSSIGEVASGENAKFSYTDVQPGAGLWFYRIQQWDVSGNSSSSRIEGVVVESKTYENLRVWPNPSTGLFRLGMPDNALYGKVVVMDLNGKVVYQKTAQGLNSAINLTSLPRGLYIIHCQSGAERLSQKLMLN